MSFNFSSVEHAIASALADVVKEAKIVSGIISKVTKTESLVETVSSFVYPPAVPIERAAYAILAISVKAINDIDAASSANGVNITLDEAIINDLKALMPDIRIILAKVGIKV